MHHDPHHARPRAYVPAPTRLPAPASSPSRVAPDLVNPATRAINAYASRYTDDALRQLARGSLAADCGYCAWGLNPDGGRHLLEHVWAGELSVSLAYNALRYTGRDDARFTLGYAGCLTRRAIRRYLHDHLVPQERPATRGQ